MSINSAGLPLYGSHSGWHFVTATSKQLERNPGLTLVRVQLVTPHLFLYIVMDSGSPPELEPLGPTVTAAAGGAAATLQESYAHWLASQQHRGRKDSEVAAAPMMMAPPVMYTMCPVCLEDTPAASILRCHALSPAPVHECCRNCFQRHVAETCTAQSIIAVYDGDVPCIECTAAAPRACSSLPWSLGDLEGVLDRGSRSAHWAAVQAAIRAPREKAAAAMALAAREAAAAAAGLALAERVKQLKAIVVDADLTLKCPRCPARFDDYVGCNALRCGACGCGFCAVCLVDCGDDAHGHIRTTHGPNYFDRPLFEHSQRAARTDRVVRRLRTLAPNLVLQRALTDALAWELGDLGIAAEDVLGIALAPAGTSSSVVASEAAAAPGAPVARAVAPDIAHGAALGAAAIEGLAVWWRCNRCTLVNPRAADLCGACGAADDALPPLIPAPRRREWWREQLRRVDGNRAGAAAPEPAAVAPRDPDMPELIPLAVVQFGRQRRRCAVCARTSDRGLLANGICLDCMPGGR